MGRVAEQFWHSLLFDPSGQRENKPRKNGKTMVIDKGLGIRAYQDLLETAGAYIDIIKIGFGTAALHPPDVLVKKTALAKQHHICIIPGGTFLEVAISQRTVGDFFAAIKSLGFSGIEVSDGTIDMTRSMRSKLIVDGKASGLTVFTEYGKKISGANFNFDRLADTVLTDLSLGAELVTVEGRESGKGAGIFDLEGKCNEDDIRAITQLVPEHHRLMWETPLKSQQVQFIKLLGRHVNLGNIAPQDILSVESLRRGLRSDTFVASDALIEMEK